MLSLSEELSVYQQSSVDDIAYLIFPFLDKKTCRNFAIVNKISIRYAVVYTRMFSTCVYCNLSFDMEDFLKENVTSLACGHLSHRGCLQPLVEENDYNCMNCQSPIYSREILDEMIEKETEKETRKQKIIWSFIVGVISSSIASCAVAMGSDEDVNSLYSFCGMIPFSYFFYKLGSCYGQDRMISFIQRNYFIDLRVELRSRYLNRRLLLLLPE